MDGIYYDGTPGEKMHNLYPLLYNKAIYEATKEETGEGIVWSRSAFAGSQRYPLHWGGDSSPNYENIIPQLEGGLSLGLSGFQFWSQDIGGFLKETNDKLLIRWLQFSVFLSHCRIHGAGNRELYKFKPETVDIWREYLQLRYSLMPYIYASAKESVENSLPMARPLVLEFQEDRNVWSISDQYMFGNSLMIAPIYNEEGKRRVYLPEGIWTNWWTKEAIKGGRWINVEVDIRTLPIYIREGAVIPMGPVMNYVDEITTDNIELLIAPFEKEGETNILVPVNDEDVKVSYKYYNCEHSVEISDTKVKFNIRGLDQVTLNLSHL